MESEFILPERIADLVDKNKNNSHFVKKTYTINEIPKELSGKFARVYCVNAVQETYMVIIFTQIVTSQAAKSAGDSFFFLDHFDTIFAVIHNAACLQPPIICSAMDILLTAAGKLGEDLNSHCPNNEITQQKRYRNITKIVFWSMVTLIKESDQAFDMRTKDKMKKYEEKRFQVQSTLVRLVKTALLTHSIVDGKFVT